MALEDLLITLNILLLINNNEAESVVNQLHLLLQHKMNITQTKESSVDLTLAEHLASLTSCAKGGVDIYKVNCDLSTAPS